MSSEIADKPVSSGGQIGKPEKFDDDTTLMDGLLDGKFPDAKTDEKEVEDEEIETDEKEQEDDGAKEEDVDKQEEEIVSDRAIDLKKIKEKYPEFAKTNEYRELRNAYYRESKYTELFPTLEDAQEAAENNEMFNKMNSDLLEKGDVTNLLNAIKEANPQSFKKVSVGFIDTLSKVDTGAWQEVMGVLVKRIARDLDSSGKKFLARNQQSDDGKALVATARNILLHYFDDDKVDLREAPAHNDQVSEKEKELEAREQQIAQQQYTSAYRSLESFTMKKMDEMIMDGLDPNESLSDFTRKALLKEIHQEISEQISADTNHVKKMTSLWNRAAQNGYDRASLSRIASAYLERARPIIPTVRNKFRSMAIKGNGQPRDESVKIPRGGKSGRPPSNDGKVNVRAADPKKIDYSKTSDNDIFEGRASLKRDK